MELSVIEESVSEEGGGGVVVSDDGSSEAEALVSTGGSISDSHGMIAHAVSVPAVSVPVESPEEGASLPRGSVGGGTASEAGAESVTTTGGIVA